MPATLKSLDTVRWGLKGPQAALWLQQRKVTPPHQPNTWAPLEPGSIIMRLGAAEFFLEDHAEPGTGQSRHQAVAAELFEPVPGVYPVLREDRALLLEGSAASTVLSEVSSFDFAGLSASARQVVMTLMLGIAVMVVPQGEGAGRVYRIWCDPSYGDSLDASLQTIAAEMQ